MSTKKHCPGCSRDLDLEEFAWRYMAKSIHQVWCKACLKEANRVHYLNNIQLYKNRATERNERVRVGNKQRLFDYLSGCACVDCGNVDMRVLEFDHVYGKKLGNISRMLESSPWEVIEAEIAKCEVRCANCHRIKTMSAVTGGGQSMTRGIVR